MDKRRYTITNSTVGDVNAVGGTDVKATRHCNIIFATLTEEQASILKRKGATVTEQIPVKATTMVSIPKEEIAPPLPIEAGPTYTPSQLVEILGFDEARKLTDPELSGAGINIVVVDSGIRKTHSAIGEDRIVYEHDYTGSDNPSDVFDHGTGVAHAILTAAPKANILNLKVLGSDGFGSPEHLINAIDYCITLHDNGNDYAPRIINLSLGINYEDTIGYEDPVRLICREAIANNIWVIAAAGNAGYDPETDSVVPSSIMVPAVEKHVLAVGSCSFNPFRVSDWSSRGPSPESPYITKPDAVFLGENLYVASSRHDTAHIAKSGTSYATPFVAGICALYQEAVYHQIVQYPEYMFRPAKEIWEIIRIEDLIDTHLIKFCIRPWEAGAGKDNDYGYGLPYGTLFMKGFMHRPEHDRVKLITSLVTIGMLGMIIRAIG